MTPEQQQLLEDVNNRLKRVESNLGGLTNDPRQVEVIRNAIGDNLVLESLRTNNFGLVVNPVGQQNSITSPTGGVVIDVEARTAINSILFVIDTFGLTK